MQTVNVLGHDRLAFALALQSRQPQVSCVGLCAVHNELLAVKVKEFRGVPLIKAVGEHRLRRVPELLVVQAVHAAEVRDAGLGGHAGAAEKHDVVRAVCQLFQSADGIVHTVLHFFCKERLS